MPEVRSPYSAEGMPRTTSTLSMSSAPICRKSVPTGAAALKPPCESVPLLERGIPSTMMFVPKATLALLVSVRS